MTDHFIAAQADAVGNLGHLLANGCVEQMAHWEFEIIHHVEDAPDADTQAVVAPAEVTGVGLRPQCRWGMAEAFTKAEILDIQRNIKREFLAFGPMKSRTLMDR